MKRTLAVLLAVTMMFSLSACSSGSTAPAAAPDPTPYGEPLSTGTTADGLSYKVFSDYAEISDCDEGVSSITIPAKIEGKPVTGIGDRAFYRCGALTSVVIPDSVTSIGDGAFELCESLTSITIPDSVTSIGDHAFVNCSMTSVNIPENVSSIGRNPWWFGYHFGGTLTKITVSANNQHYKAVDNVLYTRDGSTIITYPSGSMRNSFSIPKGVSSIGDSAFAGCARLTSVDIPASVTSIGDEAFYMCDSLERVNIPASVISIGANPWSFCWTLSEIIVSENNPNFKAVDNVLYTRDGSTLITYPGGNTSGSFNFPKGVTSIGDGAFAAGSYLQSLSIPASVTSIGDKAFYFCNIMWSVDIPDSVTSIGDMAFGECYSLSRVNIPASVTSIGDEAFYLCDSLERVNIPASVISIGANPWSYCWTLSEIIVSENNPNFKAVDNVLYTRDGSTLIAYPRGNWSSSFNIPKGVASIGDRAFTWCSGLTSIDIPASVTSIGEKAFAYCDSLLSVNIPDSVTSIGESAFEDCYSLSTINYAGTQEQWNEIEGHGQIPSEVTIQYNVR